MTKDPIVVSGRTTTLGAARAMRDAHQDAVVVVDADGYGIVTEHDITVRAVAEGVDPGHLDVGTLCGDSVLTVSPSQTIDEVIHLMRMSGSRRLPVVDQGTLVGTVSLGSLALERDLDGDLGGDSFFFEGPSGHFDFRAENLLAFVHLAGKVSDETWLRHLHQGNYSTWFAEVLKDPVLAAEAAIFQSSEGMPAAESRAGIRAAIKSLYASV